LNPDLVVEQRRLYSANPDSDIWKDDAQRWNLNVLLIAVSGFRSMQKLDPLAFCQSTTWRPVYMDDASIVFLRDVPQNRHLIDRLQIDCGSQSLTPPATTSRPQLYDFYLNSGGLFFSLHRDQEAEQSLKRASELYPEDPNAHLMLAGLYQRQRRRQAAEAEYLTSLALNENSGAWYSLGQLRATQGRYSEAVQAIERAAAMSTESLDLYMVLSRLELDQGHPQKALEMLSNAEKNSPFRDGGEAVAPELYAQIAEGRSEAHRMLGHWTEAVAYQSEAVRLTPWMSRRWSRLAQLYEATGQSALAMEAQQKAAKLAAQTSLEP
jgi:tetratricopeptide (TPR) repeat protein